jgi:hypothetical protein
MEHLQGLLALAASPARARDDDLSGRGRARVDGERQAEIPPWRRLKFRIGVSATSWSRARICSVTASTRRRASSQACRAPQAPNHATFGKASEFFQQPVGAAKRAGCWIIPTAPSTAWAGRSSRTQRRSESPPPQQSPPDNPVADPRHALDLIRSLSPVISQLARSKK